MKNYYLIFKKIDNLIKNRYILSEKKKDWESILLEYEDRIKFISNDEEFIRVINLMLSVLKDPHTNFENIHNRSYFLFPFNFMWVQDKLIVSSQNEYLPKGAVILRVNSLSMASLLQNKKMENLGLPMSAIKMKINNYLYGISDDKLNIKYSFDNKIFNCKVSRQLIPTKKTDKNDIYIYSKKINEEIDYIKIPCFLKGIFNQVCRWDRTIKNPNKLIIDLRGSQGGFVSEAIQCTEFFSSCNVFLGNKVYKSEGKKITERVIILAKADTPKFKKIIILIDNFTLSSSEFIFLRGLIKNPCVNTLGEQTAGIVHGMKRFVIQDQYLIELTVCRYYDDKGIKATF